MSVPDPYYTPPIVPAKKASTSPPVINVPTVGTTPMYQSPSMPGSVSGVDQAARPESMYAGWNAGGLPLGGLLGTALAGIGVLGAGSQGSYQPQERALSRFYELTDPNSDYHKKLRAMYGRYLADSSPTQNTLLGLARSGGSDVTTASALALRQGQAQASQNREQILNMEQRDRMATEQTAASYLNMYEQSRQYADKANASDSFFNNVLGLGGSLLSKFLA